jgi:hypothetical protein
LPHAFAEGRRAIETIPEPHKHLVRFYGAYANRVRSERLARNDSTEPQVEHHIAGLLSCGAGSQMAELLDEARDGSGARIVPRNV